MGTAVAHDLPMSSSPAGNRPALRETLTSLRLASSTFTEASLTAPWSERRPATGETFSLYVVTEGECTVAPDEGMEVTLGPGEMALVPGTMPHTIASSLGSAPSESSSVRHQLTDNFDTLTARGDGEHCRVLMGTLDVVPGAGLRVLRQLPPVIKVFPKDGLSGVWVPATIRMIVREAIDKRTAADDVMTRLADLVVLFMTRTWLEQADYDGGAPSAWADERIGSVVARLHERPADPWTVAEMARAAGMSRSAFAQRFTEVTGSTPLQMVAERRMLQADRMLRTGDETVATIAARCGYASESSFGRAFRRTYGTTPAAARRAAHEERKAE